MRALQDTIAALGEPVLVRTLGAPAAAAAAIARWRHGPGVVQVGPSDTIRLAMSLVDRQNARIRSNGSTARVPGASISVFSPTEGASVEVRGEADVIQLFLDRNRAEAMVEAPLVCPPTFDLRDDSIRTLMLRILIASADRGPDDALSVDQDLNGVALRLERHANQWRARSDTPPVPFRGGLAPVAYRRVDAMIENALDKAGSPTLTEMAAAAGLSVTHFVRAFRNHTGDTPHRRLVRRRMDRAVSLLRDAKEPVAEVADRVGFSTTAHFVATFRAAMGVTPGALREGLAR